jgi:hypothetical protein
MSKTITGVFTGASGTSPKVILERPHVHLSGNFGGGTVTVQAQLGPNNGWVALTGGVLTAADDFILDAQRPIAIRVVLTGATGASIVYALR